jgi:hypothetical protein
MGEVQLTITLNQQNGQVSVNGPIDNKILSYAMLESARDAIYEYNRQKQESRIITPAPQDFSLPKLD